MAKARTWTWTLAVVGALTLASCSGGDDPNSAADSDNPVVSKDGPSGTANGANANDGAGPVRGMATLTVGDGTEYTFSLTTCRTSGNEPDAFQVDSGYDLIGESEDGFKIRLNRAEVKEGRLVELGILQGQFDESGSKPKVSYAGLSDADFDLRVDGGAVTGTATLKSLFGPSIHGETIEVTLDARCGAATSRTTAVTP